MTKRTLGLSTLLLVALPLFGAQALERKFVATWDAVSGANKYCLYHGTRKSSLPDKKCTAGKQTKLNWTLTVETGTDWFGVTAVSNGNESELSNLVKVTTELPPPDADNDGIPDDQDNCPTRVNRGQANNDGDSKGDVCDPNDDNDAVADATDNCRFIANNDQADADNDGIGDVCDDTPGGGGSGGGGNTGGGGADRETVERVMNLLMTLLLQDDED